VLAFLIALLTTLAAAVPHAVPTERAARPAMREPVALPRPAITRELLPIGPRRRSETAAYARRHYGRAITTVDPPRAIVEHLTEIGSVQATWDLFARDVADAELGELPATCAQFVIARNGRIVQLTPVTFLCRHTVGLNWAAIGIEHVGFSEDDVLGNPAQLRASLRLTRWLRCRYDIPVRDVIGHAESVGSRWHRERVAALRDQTHDDWQPWAMRRYRELVRRMGC
jgi:N-acetylmuramoyl-L-alanine amidase-like protein